MREIMVNGEDEISIGESINLEQITTEIKVGKKK